MRKIKRALALIAGCLLLFFALPIHLKAEAAPLPFFAADQPDKKPGVGEKIIYDIHYHGIPVGRSESLVKEITEINGRKAYHVEVHVKSFPMIDLFYKVRDEHHTYIDFETLASLRYEKKIHEGFRHVEEHIVFDPEKHLARYLSKDGKTLKEIEVPPFVQDALSCGYFFRTMTIEPHQSVFIPVHADGKNWNMEVKLGQARKMGIKGIGIFEALETEPLMEFEGIFIRKGRVTGWISLDNRRIPLTMKVKIPVLGSVTGELAEYYAGHQN